MRPKLLSGLDRKSRKKHAFAQKFGTNLNKQESKHKTITLGEATEFVAENWTDINLDLYYHEECDHKKNIQQPQVSTNYQNQGAKNLYQNKDSQGLIEQKRQIAENKIFQDPYFTLEK